MLIRYNQCHNQFGKLSFNCGKSSVKTKAIRFSRQLRYVQEVLHLYFQKKGKLLKFGIPQPLWLRGM